MSSEKKYLVRAFVENDVKEKLLEEKKANGHGITWSVTMALRRYFNLPAMDQKEHKNVSDR